MRQAEQHVRPMGVEHWAPNGCRTISLLPMSVRILANCEPEPNTGCWLWTGTMRGNGTGYGCISVKHELVAAHRASYEAFKGPIPEGLHIDHLCRVRCCVNPDHLEAVTPRVNVLRGDTVVAANAAKTHCRHGHPFDADNTYVHQGQRACRECQRANGRRCDAKRRPRGRTPRRVAPEPSLPNEAEVERIILAMQRIIATAATPERLAQVRERVRNGMVTA